MIRISHCFNLQRAITADDQVFQHLLGHRTEGIIRIGRIEAARENRNPRERIRQLLRPSFRLDSPPHTGDAVFDRIDRAPRNRRLRKAP